MLVLSRKKNETVCIDGHRIQLRVLGIKGDKVRLGFDAPDDVSIHRGEVQDAIDNGIPKRT